MTIENKTSILGIPIWSANLQPGDIRYDFDSSNNASSNRLLRKIGAQVTSSLEVLDPDTVTLQHVINPPDQDPQIKLD